MLAACSSDNDIDNASGNDEEYAITLAAGIGGLTTSSRAAETYNDTVPSSTSPLAADVWLSSDRGVYIHKADDYVTSTHAGNDEYHLHHQMTYTSGQLTFLNASSVKNLLLYSVDKTKRTYIVGFYPQNVFSLVGSEGDSDYGKTAEASVDGRTDLMFAPEVYGSRVTTEKIARQDFKHILTWLKVCARAENEEAVNSWGRIIGLKLKNAKTNVTVDLSTTDINTLRPTFTGDTDMNFDRKDNGNSGTISEENYYPLTTYITEMADILCAPVEINNPSEDNAGTAEYTLEVTTTGGVVKEVPVQLSRDYDGNNIDNGHYTASELYVISLVFGLSPTISASCSLQEWDNEARDLLMK